MGDELIEDNFMSLGIALKSSSMCRAVTHFEDDGYFWYLAPTFENVWKHTGTIIDLYEVTEFTSAHLPILLRFLEQAKREASQKSDQWDVLVGKDGFSGELIYKTVSRQILMEKLEPFVQSVKEAIETNGQILCIGD